MPEFDILEEAQKIVDDMPSRPGRVIPYNWELINGVKTELLHTNYAECPIPTPSCDECEDYYWREVHADFCDEDCGQRESDSDGEDVEVYGEGICVGCTCEHCEEKK